MPVRTTPLGAANLVGAGVQFTTLWVTPVDCIDLVKEVTFVNDESNDAIVSVIITGIPGGGVAWWEGEVPSFRGVVIPTALALEPGWGFDVFVNPIPGSGNVFLGVIASGARLITA